MTQPLFVHVDSDTLLLVDLEASFLNDRKAGVGHLVNIEREYSPQDI